MLAPSRRAVGIAAMTLLIGSLGMTAAVFVAGPASASSSASSTTSTSTTGTGTTPALPLPSPTTTTTTTGTGTGTTASGPPTSSNPTAAKFFVINGTVHAASDHERVGSSAFPNYATGAVDNYYSMALSHVDNSPFAQGTASPADTGPVGQTAAAGNFQQPQYADARWPGSSGTAKYGTQGQPYAVADASDYRATAESSEASSGLNGTSPSTQMAAPKGFNGRLRQALATWKAKWLDRLHPKTGAVKPPTPTVTIPTLTVTTPAATVSTPSVPVGGLPVTPPVSAPSPAGPSAAVPQTATPTRSTSSASTTPADGASILESSTLATLDSKAEALVTSGESRLGRVSLGGGQIVIQGIHVSASIANDGTPTEKIAVDVGAASIGGVPVTIDQDGVHVSGQGAALPYQQASDALNGALKQAGIQLFVVSPEIKKGGDSSTGTGTTTTPVGTPPIGTTTATTTTTSTTTSDGTGTTTTTGSSDGTTTTTSACGGTGTTTTGTTTTGTTTTGTTSTTTTTDTNPSGGTDTTGDTMSANEETVKATGLHVVFIQPVEQAGVPTQYVEHILGEVSLDSLAVPAGALPDLNLNLNSSPSSSCSNGQHTGSKKTSGGASKGGGSSAGRSSSSSSPSGSAPSSGFSQPTSGVAGSASQPTSSSTTAAPQSFPVRLASALRKPMWLLLAYLLWQALVIATGASLWSWRRGEAS
jgi:hypothetical protein